VSTSYFLDTNILVYATSLAPDHLPKREVARAWVARPDWGVSTQVLMELFAQARHRHYLSHWDAAILCAARRLGAHTVVSEDLAPGQDYGGVRVLNPFQSPPSGLVLA
jgi:predicted nucleic acid-binding protein